MLEPPGSLILEMQRVAHRLMARLEPASTRLDLSTAEVNALVNLLHRGGTTVSELAQACGAKPSTLTGILDRLEAAGLLGRRPHPGDRRALLLRLTPTGRAKARTAAATMAAVEQALRTAVAPDAMDGFREVLQHLSGGDPASEDPTDASAG